MTTQLKNLWTQVRNAADSVLADLHNWSHLSNEGACHVRQLVATMIAAGQEDMDLCTTLAEEAVVLMAMRERLEALIRLRTTFENHLKLAFDAGFAQLILAMNKEETCAAEQARPQAQVQHQYLQ